MMKKAIAILLVALMTLGMFAACGSEASNSKNGEDHKPSNPLIGSWSYQEGDWITTYEFRDGGKLKVYEEDVEGHKGGTQMFDYTIDGNVVTITNDIFGENVIPFSVKGDTLTFTVDGVGGSMFLDLTRK